MQIKLAGAVSTIYVIGESHSVQFGSLFLEPTWAADKFHCQSRFFPTLMAKDYMANGLINPILMDALTADGILLEGSAHYLIRDGSAAYLTGAPILAPPMVFFAGDLDLQNLFRQLGEQYDFELPGDTVYGVNFDKQPIDYETIRRQIADALQPFVTVMSRLRPVFPRLMVHALPPRTRDNQRAHRWCGPSDAPVRAKLTVAANQFLAQALAPLDIPLIDTTEQISLDGYLNPAFDLDGLHLTREGGLYSLEAIVASLYDRTAVTANPGRYEYLLLQAPAYEAARAEDDLAWAERGYATCDLGREIAAAADDLSFTSDPPNLAARLDWAGYPRNGRRGVAVAEPSNAVLEKAARLLVAGSGRACLQAGQAKELTVGSFRPIELWAGGSADAGGLPTPFGCRRALLCLDDAGAVCLRALGGELVTELPRRAGLLITYDPTLLSCVATALGGPARFVEMTLAPRLRNHPFRVVAAGLNDWPADPFCYSVAGIRAFTPFTTDKVLEFTGV
jgi:hypothetical protein